MPWGGARKGAGRKRRDLAGGEWSSKRCTKCCEVKPLDEFHKGNSALRKTAWCKACTKAIAAAAYRRRNPRVRMSRRRVAIDRNSVFCQRCSKRLEPKTSGPLPRYCASAACLIRARYKPTRSDAPCGRCLIARGQRGGGLCIKCYNAIKYSDLCSCGQRKLVRARRCLSCHHRFQRNARKRTCIGCGIAYLKTSHGPDGNKFHSRECSDKYRSSQKRERSARLLTERIEREAQRRAATAERRARAAVRYTTCKRCGEALEQPGPSPKVCSKCRYRNYKLKPLPERQVRDVCDLCGCDVVKLSPRRAGKHRFCHSCGKAYGRRYKHVFSSEFPEELKDLVRKLRQFRRLANEANDPQRTPKHSV